MMHHPSLCIAVLGAESTGKSSLAAALAHALQHQYPPKHTAAGGWVAQVALVDEYLRTWCIAHQRLPLAAEQDHIAQTQAQHIDAAAADARVVVADTTPLMTAVYSEFYFGDVTLYTEAWACQRRFVLHLLMGTDVFWQADGTLRDGPRVRDAVDEVLRRRLTQANVRFHTLYGSLPERLRTALLLVQTLTNTTPHMTATPPVPIPMHRYAPFCVECSTPEGERSLFKRLQRRNT